MKRKFTKDDVLTIPNCLSFFRLLLIPLIVWLYCGKKQYLASAAVVALSALTDIADGKIARKFHMVSDFGKILDPIADKLTQAALMICLLTQYSWFWLLLLLFVVKEGLMALWGYLTLKHTDTVNSARWYGKASTAVLYAVMMVLILFPGIPETAANILISCCCIFMLLSLIMYGRFYHGVLSKENHVGADTPFVWAGRILMLALWIAIIVLFVLHKDEFTVDSLLRYTPSNPVMAAIVMLLLFALKSISMVLYSGILYAANGILFSLPIAILLNLLGTAIMVTIPYFIGRKTGAAAVERITAKHPKAAQLRELRQENDFFFSFLMRVIARLPSDVASMYMGAIGVRYRSYLAGCILGFLPAVVTFSVMGTTAEDIQSPAFWIALCVQIAYTAVSALLYYLYKKKRKTMAQNSQLRHAETEQELQ